MKKSHLDLVLQVKYLHCKMADVQDRKDVVTTEKSEQPGHETGLTSYRRWIVSIQLLIIFSANDRLRP